MASIVLAVLFVLCLIYRISQKNIFRFSSFLMFWLMMFYLMHVTGLINTLNFPYAGLDLQIKLSFLLMPLLLDQVPVSTTDYRRLTRSFIAGCTLFSMVLLVNAILEYTIWHDSASFFYIDFCSLQHVAYFTLYINCALFFLTDEFYRMPGYRLRSRYLLAVWMLYLLVIVILLASRTAEMALLASLPLYIYLLTRLTGSRTRSLLFSCGAAVTMILVFFIISGTHNRFEEKNAAPLINTETAVASTSGVQHNVRFEIWKNALQLYSRNILFGTGTGDIKDELHRQYEKNNFQEGLIYNLNPHNQFLHTLVALGIPGLLVLVMIFFSAASKAIKKKNYILSAFVIAVFINCMTEGLLEKQAGVLFFVFFMIILSRQQNELTALKKAEA
jgi:O-antigen ligase